MLETVYIGFVGQMLEDFRAILEVLGPGLAMVGFGLYIVYNVWRGIQNMQLKKLEAQQQQQKVDAEVKLLNAQTESQLKLADQQADAAVTTRRDAMLSELIKLSAKFSETQVKFNETQVEAVRTSNSIGEILRIVQMQQATIANQLATYRDADELFQSTTTRSVDAIQTTTFKTSQIIETLPAKLDGNHEKQMQELAAISTRINSVHDSLIRAVEDSRAELNASILKIAVDVASDSTPDIREEIPDLKELVDSLTEMKSEPVSPVISPEEPAAITEPPVAPDPSRADIVPGQSVEAERE